MLTAEALSSRRWGAFPALREGLEQKAASRRYDGLLSVSDTIFAAFEHYLNIAALADEHKNDLVQAATTDRDFADAAVLDLQRLSQQLEALRQHLANQNVPRFVSHQRYTTEGPPSKF